MAIAKHYQTLSRPVAALILSCISSPGDRSLRSDWTQPGAAGCPHDDLGFCVKDCNESTDNGATFLLHTQDYGNLTYTTTAIGLGRNSHGVDILDSPDFSVIAPWMPSTHVSLVIEKTTMVCGKSAEQPLPFDRAI